VKNATVLALMTGQAEERNTTGYMVESPAYDYNDEYYSESETGRWNNGEIWLDREKAEAKAFLSNMAHCREVIDCLPQWGYSDNWFEVVRNEDHPQEVLSRFFKILRPEEEIPSSQDALEAALRDTEEAHGPVSDKDVEWMVNTFTFFQSASVSTVTIKGL
jgi:hypothetical protein